MQSVHPRNGQKTAWIGAECQNMWEIVGSERYHAHPKLQTVEVFGQ